MFFFPPADSLKLAFFEAIPFLENGSKEFKCYVCIRILNMKYAGSCSIVEEIDLI